MTDRILTLNHAGILGDIIRGVERNLKLRFYPRGSESADCPLTYTMRAFTREGGGFYPNDKDVRDAFVWCSGTFESWFPVDVLIDALDNIDGKHGDTNPIAIIETE